MRPVSDAFLLNMAEVSAALIGLFIVGMFFFVETGFRHMPHATLVQPYFRSSTRIVLVLYAIPIGVSITLVALDLPWSRVLFAVLSVLLVAANVDTARRSRSVVHLTRSTALAANEVVGTVAVAALVVVPWALGGLHPTREDLTWGIILAFGSGFLSVCVTVLFAFDLARIDDRGATSDDVDDLDLDS